MNWFSKLLTKTFKKKSKPPVVTRPDIDGPVVKPKPVKRRPGQPLKKSEPTVMKMSNIGLEFLTRWEGFKTTIYKDVAGYPTIGVGHLLTKDELSSGKIIIKKRVLQIHNGLTHQDVIDLLSQDLGRYEDTVRSNVSVPLQQYQFDALVSFCFNVGQRAFSNSTLLKQVNAKNFADVPNQFKRWNKAGGKVIKGLVNRRNAEIALWEGKI